MSQPGASFSALCIQKLFLPPPQSSHHGRGKRGACHSPEVAPGAFKGGRGAAGEGRLVTSSQNMRCWVGAWSRNKGVVPPCRAPSVRWLQPSWAVEMACLQQLEPPLLDVLEPWSPERVCSLWGFYFDANRGSVVFEMCLESSHSCRCLSAALGSILFTPSLPSWSLVLGADGEDQATFMSLLLSQSALLHIWGSLS